ncbi:hypothetical protein ACSLOE_30455, partial [Escherichia coli]|uniref:hypothetical protein n=1 Tax=Escherichia coli TaxID=562 RepID=UPI003EE3AFE1
MTRCLLSAEGTANAGYSVPLSRKEQEDTERSRAEQLRKNDNAVMDSGVLRAVVTGYGEAPMPG